MRKVFKVLKVRWLAISLLVLVAGCRQRDGDSADAAQAAKKKVAAIASSTSATEQGAPSGPASSQATPAAGTPAVDPIDQIPQGKRYRTAVSAIDRGDTETAAKIQQELASDPQYRSLATAIEALLLIRQGKLDQAIHLAEEISAIPVMQGEAYTIAGEVYQRENRLSEATAAFENAVAINPQHVRAHRWLGAIYYDTGAMRLATTHLRTAAQLDPVDVNSLMLSARIFQDYEQYQEAIADYRAVLERQMPTELTLLAKAKLAECLIKLRKLDEAEQALEGSPPAPGVLASRAAIAEARGETETALELARQALERAPDSRSAAIVLSRIYLAERQWDQALPVLKHMVDEAPFDHEPRLLYGRALVGVGDREAGEAQIKQATELKDTFLKFADLHQDAIKNPQDVPLRIQLGRLAEKLGKPKLAENWYRAAIGLQPGNQEATEALRSLNQ